jgi:hypothetical protein
LAPAEPTFVLSNFLRVERSGLAAFFAAGFLPSIGKSISFWPAEAFRGFFPLWGGVPPVAMLFFRASMRSTTFSPLGRGLGGNAFTVALGVDEFGQRSLG